MEPLSVSDFETALFRTETKERPFGNSGWAQCLFLIWKPAIFRKVKGIKYLCAGVVLYAAQTNEKIDAEIAEKGGFRTETSWRTRHCALPRPRY